jgi:hypothetical protein
MCNICFDKKKTSYCTARGILSVELAFYSIFSKHAHSLFSGQAIMKYAEEKQQICYDKCTYHSVLTEQLLLLLLLLWLWLWLAAVGIVCTTIIFLHCSVYVSY